MVKSLILTAQTAIGTNCNMILFANEKIAMDMIEFLRNRFDYFSNLNNSKATAAGMKTWTLSYNNSQGKVHGMLALADIACKNYKDQNVIYRLEVKEIYSGDTKLTDMYTDKSVAEKISNLINTQSDALHASIDEVMIINDDSSLSVLKNFLVSNRDIGEQWEYYSKIKP